MRRIDCWKCYKEDFFFFFLLFFFLFCFNVYKAMATKNPKHPYSLFLSSPHFLFYFSCSPQIDLFLVEIMAVTMLELVLAVRGQCWRLGVKIIHLEGIWSSRCTRVTPTSTLMVSPSWLNTSLFLFVCMEEVGDYCLDGFGEFLTSLHSGARWETISSARKKGVSARWISLFCNLSVQQISSRFYIDMLYLSW